MAAIALNGALREVRCSLSGRRRPFAGTAPLGLCGCCSPARPLGLVYASPAPGAVSFVERSQKNAIARYAEWMPVSVDGDYFTGVGLTTVERNASLSSELDCEVFVKNESSNPTGSFKDRGLSVAVAFGHALGAKRFCLPTQGNAGVAAALFCSRLGLEPCSVWMPGTHEGSYYYEMARHYGARVELFGSNIAEAGRAMRERLGKAIASGDIVDLSTFFEPGRWEGKKTLGLEIAEHFGAKQPDVIVYPTGGGTGLAGIWKAFEELDVAARSRLPRMVAVQAEGCAPVVDAFVRGDSAVTPVASKGTAADGLNVPQAIMGHELLRVLRASGGTAVAVTESDMVRDFSRLGQLGIPAGYESAATLSALRHLRGKGVLEAGATVLLLFTSGPNAALHR